MKEFIKAFVMFLILIVISLGVSYVLFHEEKDVIVPAKMECDYLVDSFDDWLVENNETRNDVVKVESIEQFKKLSTGEIGGTLELLKKSASPEGFTYAGVYRAYWSYWIPENYIVVNGYLSSDKVLILYEEEYMLEEVAILKETREDSIVFTINKDDVVILFATIIFVFLIVSLLIAIRVIVLLNENFKKKL